ncbi:polysaccharide deacetylase family protein [Paenibacillus albicereus]|uniref:Polysaccharide deacetylase family protein n=1 Tax=Paenibacillus albicereus TaxID=2726185 RepID=A0A6H2H153_9BACL|nr:polysaccharide deacetylase family protein [Paenibacillus albicereus]QJC53329.1 polysaccharide deacetylase family protein [Paenibacillus albicereus]
MKPLRRWLGWPALLLVLMQLLGGAPSMAGAASAPANARALPPEAANAQAAVLRPRTVSWITLSREFPGAFATRGPAGLKRVALTFDDVPDEQYTPEVLDILAREHVRATFFVVGQRAAKAPSMLRRIHAEGHAIGNHSYDHTSYARLSESKFEEQIESTSRLLKAHLGYTPRFLRPPYGEITPSQLMWTQSRGYFVVNWDVDTQDWRGLSADQIVRNAQKTLAPGSIILQHAGGGIGEDLSGTVKALPRLIRLLREKGYEMVTVPELLGESEEIERMRLF